MTPTKTPFHTLLNMVEQGELQNFCRVIGENLLHSPHSEQITAESVTVLTTGFHNPENPIPNALPLIHFDRKPYAFHFDCSAGKAAAEFGIYAFCVALPKNIIEHDDFLNVNICTILEAVKERFENDTKPFMTLGTSETITCYLQIDNQGARVVIDVAYELDKQFTNTGKPMLCHYGQTFTVAPEELLEIFEI